MKTKGWAERAEARELLNPFAGYTALCRPALHITLKQDFELHLLEVGHGPNPVRGELKAQEKKIVPTSTGLLQQLKKASNILLFALRADLSHCKLHLYLLILNFYKAFEKSPSRNNAPLTVGVTNFRSLFPR